MINQAGGVYTKLPENGDKVDCGDVLYRVDDRPVLLLCGTVPAYRDLHSGDEGKDVRQLNRNLRALDYDTAAGGDFTWKTARALKALQHDKGFDETGQLDVGDAVVLPRSVRIAKVTGELGGSARPGAAMAQATSDTLGVQVNLDASQHGQVKRGDRARITLPGNESVTGKGGPARQSRPGALEAGRRCWGRDDPGQRAEEELQNVLADVRRGVWRPPTPAAAAAPPVDPTFHEFASRPPRTGSDRTIRCSPTLAAAVATRTTWRAG